MHNVIIKFEDNVTTLLMTEQDPFQLNIGYQSLINHYVISDLPKADEVEQMIMVIEDEIMHLAPQLPPIHRLITDNNQVKQIANHLHNSHYISTEQIESVFNRFADIIVGSPRTEYDLVSTPSLIVTLIILRELLHHLNIEGVEVI